MDEKIQKCMVGEMGSRTFGQSEKQTVGLMDAKIKKCMVGKIGSRRNGKSDRRYTPHEQQIDQLKLITAEIYGLSNLRVVVVQCRYLVNKIIVLGQDSGGKMNLRWVFLLFVQQKDQHSERLLIEFHGYSGSGTSLLCTVVLGMSQMQRVQLQTSVCQSLQST